MHSLPEINKLSVKTVSLATKLSQAVPKFTEEQERKFKEISEKYNIAFEETKNNEKP